MDFGIRKSTKNQSKIDYKSLKSNMQKYSWFVLISTSFIIYLKEKYKHDGNGWCSKIIKKSSGFPIFLAMRVISYWCIVALIVQRFQIDVWSNFDWCCTDFWYIFGLKDVPKCNKTSTSTSPTFLIGLGTIFCRIFAQSGVQDRPKATKNRFRIYVRYLDGQEGDFWCQLEPNERPKQPKKSNKEARWRHIPAQ